ncbi:RelA/SpoT family protein [Thiolapillus sp.]
MVSTVSHLPETGSVSQEQITAWLAALAGHRSRKEIHQISLALELIHRVHDEEPAFGGVQHQLALMQTADILDQLNLDTETLVASLLSDLPLAELEKAEPFGERVPAMIRDLSRIRTVAVSGSSANDDKQSENLRRMLLGLADDVRVVLIVLAKRLQLMRVLQQVGEEEERRAIADITQRIHAPLANRLGVWQLKWELEDLSLRVLHPNAYRDIARALEEKREEREQFIAGVIGRLQASCEQHGIPADISGRPKHIYSIWKKMQRKGVDFSQIFDVRAVRVLVDSVAQCYEVLGMVHGAWQPIPKEFDDYIAHPKANGYRSLHTAVIGEDGKPLEVQIRTREMHDHAERGVAAHWRYKEDGKGDSELERRIEWMRAWLEHPGDTQDAEEADAEFEARRIYVLTPDGKVVELPRGATAVDFAYAIHSSVGHRCRGAKADGKMISLTQPLESGQTVEIITVKEGGPSLDWLNASSGYVTTSRARNRIRHWFKRQDYEQHVALGKASLDKEINRLGVKKPDLEKLLEKYNFKTVDDLYAAMGRGEVSAIQVANLQVAQKALDDDRDIALKADKRSVRHKAAAGEVVVQGVDGLMTHTARCCKPVPNDPIMGYITRGKGVSIHRADCPVLRRLKKDQAERLISVVWSEEQPRGVFLVDVQLHAHDRKGLLRDISSVFSNEEVDVLGVKTHSNRKKETASMRFTVEVANMEQLSRVMEKLAQVPDVMDVKRQV